MNEKQTPQYKYFAYVRKSTEGEERQAISIESQKDIIRKHFNGLKIVDILEEKHSAFKPYNRPVFEDMIKRIRKGEVQGIIAWHPDRLSRNEIDASTITYLVRTDVIKDLKFGSYNFDNSPEGIMMLQLALSQSQYSSSKLSRDVKRGLEKKIEMGWKPGTAPEGYLNDKIEQQGLKKVLVDKKRFPLIRKTIDLYLTGNYTVPQVWSILNNKWGYRTVKRKAKGGGPMTLSGFYRILTDPFYTGHFNYKGQLYKGKHKALITMAEYDRIQEMLGRKDRPRPIKHTFPFTGSLKCAECGCSITAETKRKKNKTTKKIITYEYYHCTHKRNTPTFHCKQPSITATDLHKTIENELVDITITSQARDWAIEYLDRQKDKSQDDNKKVADTILTNIEQLKNELSGLTKMRYRDLISDEEFAKNRQELNDKIIKFETELKNLDTKEERSIELTKDVFNFAVYAHAEFLKGDDQTKKEILATLGSNHQLLNKNLMITLFPWFSKIKDSTIPSSTNFFRLELPQTRINTTEKEAFASLIPMMHGMRESNPRLNFWRVACYHYTNPANRP